MKCLKFQFAIQNWFQNSHRIIFSSSVLETRLVTKCTENPEKKARKDEIRLIPPLEKCDSFCGADEITICFYRPVES